VSSEPQEFRRIKRECDFVKKEFPGLPVKNADILKTAPVKAPRQAKKFTSHNPLESKSSSCNKRARCRALNLVEGPGNEFLAGARFAKINTAEP